MRKTLGLIFVVMLMLTALPFWAEGEPTREADVSLTGLIINGDVGPGGEYEVGTHTLFATLDNVGNESYHGIIEFHVQVAYDGNATLYEEYIYTTPAPTLIDAEGQRTIDIGDILFEEDIFDILVEANLSGNFTSFDDTFIFMDVEDLSIENAFIDPGAEILKGDVLTPLANVTYLGNKPNWANPIMVNLSIYDVAADTRVYNDLLDSFSLSSQKQPGDYFFVSGFDTWVVSSSGPHRAVFNVTYDTYDLENNVDIVEFDVLWNPSVEGYVNTTGGTPLIGVIVDATKGNFSALAMTNETGYYAIYDLEEGSYSLNFSKAWVMPYDEFITVAAGETLMFNATLTPTNNCGLMGAVSLPDELPAEGATVTASLVGGGMDTTTTDDTGLYEFPDLVAGTYDMMVTLTGYADGQYTDIQLIPMKWNELDMELGEMAFTVSVDPPEGEPGFAIGDDITVTFSRPLDPTSVGPETLMLRNMQNGTIVSVEYSFSDDNTIVTMSSMYLLANGVDYRVEVTSLITDVNSNYFSGPFYSNFTTESGVVTIGVEERYPTAGGSEIPVDTDVRVIFPEPMDGDTIDEDTFYLMRGSVRVLATVEYSASDYTAILSPTYPLEYSTTYTVMVEETIGPLDEYKDFIGDSWVFNTAPMVTAGSIQGFVKDENGNAFPSYLVDITLTEVGATEGVPIPLQATGEFRYENKITEGDYELLIEVDGYKDILKTFSMVPGHTEDLGAILMEVESVSDEDDNKVPIWVYFLIIAVVIIFLFWVIWLMMNKKEEPEEDTRRMRFGGGRGRQHEEFGEPMEGEFLCPTCGYVVEADESDCPNCGSEFEEDLFECPECGANLSGDALECPECGSAFEEEVPEDEYGEEEEEEEEYDPTEEYEVEDDDDYEAPLGMVE